MKNEFDHLDKLSKQSCQHPVFFPMGSKINRPISHYMNQLFPLVLTDNNWAVSVVYNIVTDRAQDGSPNGAQTTTPHHYQFHLLLVG